MKVILKKKKGMKVMWEYLSKLIVYTRLLDRNGKINFKIRLTYKYNL